jgi:hypothetical protein
MIMFYVKRGIARTPANPNYARGIIPFTCDMYVRLRITRYATNMAAHDNTNCINLDRSMSLGCVEDMFTSFLTQNEQKIPRCVYANSRACPFFLLATNVGPHTRTYRWWRSHAPIKVSE